MYNLSKFLEEVDYAIDNVPFYQEKLSRLGVAKNDINVETFRRVLPFTDKRDYRKNFPIGVLAKGYKLSHPMLTKSQSSGTTGERLTTPEVGINLLRRAIGCAGISPLINNAFVKKGRKICRYAAPNCSDVECANPNSSFEDRLLPDGTLVLPVYHDLLTTSEELKERAIEELMIFKPDLLYVDPTHYAFLLREFKKRNIQPPTVPVVTSYSAMTNVSARQIVGSLPAGEYVSELLSSSEMGWIAMQCPRGNMHLNDDSFFFEFIDDVEGIGAPGGTAELCISSIDRGAAPHLRYRTADMVRLKQDTCECGSHRRVVTVEGRATHFLSHNDKPLLSPYQVDQLVGAPDWLDLYQLEQVDADEFVFKIIVNDCYRSGNESEFVGLLSNLWPGTTKVRTECVDYIASERSGKFQPVKGLLTNV